jgi:hypothetical protein
MSASDGDDDYMSPEFLQKINDVKPGFKIH